MFIYNFKINGTKTFKLIGSIISIIVIEETPNCDKQKVNPPDDSYIQTSPEL